MEPLQQKTLLGCPRSALPGFCSLACARRALSSTSGLLSRDPLGPLPTPTTGSGDEGLSSDGERGGDEYCDEYSWSIGAEDAMGGEFGGGPWSGEDPYAYGGAD